MSASRLPTGHDRTTIVCFQDADRPGSLYAILGRFAARDINLTKLESRPTKRGLGDYCFVIEFEGHVADDVVADCLADLQAHLARVKFLGSYPVTGDDATDRREEVVEARRSADEWIKEIRSRITSESTAETKAQDVVSRSRRLGDGLGRRAGAQVLVDDVEQLLEVERLGEVLVDTGVSESSPLPGRRVGREYDHGNVDGSRIALEPLQHFEAVDVGQVHVEQDQVRAVLLGQFDTHDRPAAT